VCVSYVYEYIYYGMERRMILIYFGGGLEIERECVGEKTLYENEVPPPIMCSYTTC